VRTAEILVLDDLGASKPSAWVLESLIGAERAVQRAAHDDSDDELC